MPVLSLSRVRAVRLWQSGLYAAGRVAGGEASTNLGDIARRHCGVQAQVFGEASAALALRSGQSIAEVDAALMAMPPALVWTWGQRGTLHLHAPDDWPQAVAMLGEQVTEGELKRALARNAETEYGKGSPRRTGEEWHAAVLDTTRRMREYLAMNDSIVSTQMPEEGMCRFTQRASMVAMTMDGTGARFNRTRLSEIVARRVLLPDLEWDPLPSDAAWRMRVERFFATYGPTLVSDVSYYFGSRVAPARAACQALIDAGTIVPVDVAGRAAVMDDGQLYMHRDVVASLADFAEPPVDDPLAWPILFLPRFDPYLLAVKNKRVFLESGNLRAVWTINADIRCTLILCGRIAGTYALKKRAGALDMAITPIDAALLAPARVRSAVEAAAQTAMQQQHGETAVSVSWLE